MKKVFAFFAFIAISLPLLSANSVQAQSPGVRPAETRPRAVTAPSEDSVYVADSGAEPDQARHVSGALAKANQTAQAIRQLTPTIIHARIDEAERLFKSRPRPTSLSSTATDSVTLALLDRATGRIHLLNVSKQIFLVKNSEAMMVTSLGTPVTLRVVRVNGVNTAVKVVDPHGQALAPLMVEFPIERGGVYKETGYYTSAHPDLLSAELTRSGQTYVRSMIDLAAKRLRERGAFIAPNIVDVAERLCLVEHVDHERFRNENRKTLFDEIYSLYALNELNTYRFSVSVAGAGGMVQMIPWAYNLERQRHPGVGLMPDFVIGMRNHQNALQAMLLYMQDTWNDLAASSDVQAALEARIATPTELLAAGYNSNAAKLPLYLRRGGNGWRTLIPRETQMYLQIYKSVDSLIPAKPRPAAPAMPKAE